MKYKKKENHHQTATDKLLNPWIFYTLIWLLLLARICWTILSKGQDFVFQGKRTYICVRRAKDKGLEKVNHLYVGDIINMVLTTNLSFSDDGRVYCNATLDPFSCWPATPGGHYAVISCPEVPGVDASSMVFDIYFNAYI